MHPLFNIKSLLGKAVKEEKYLIEKTTRKRSSEGSNDGKAGYECMKHIIFFKENNYNICDFILCWVFNFGLIFNRDRNSNSSGER